jgi:hypothetical protein
MTIVRYPNRRTLLKLLSNPAFGALESYKFMAMELDLVPVSGTFSYWLVGYGPQGCCDREARQQVIFGPDSDEDK